MSSTEPATTVSHGSDDMATAKQDPKPNTDHSEQEALLKALDHFRTSFMAHFYDVVTPLYTHHQNTKPAIQSEEHTKDHWPFHKHHDVPEERRVHTFVDVRETKSHFYADVEIAGVEDKESITVQWTSPRTLLVEVTIPRPDVEPWDSKTGDNKAVSDEKKGEEGVTLVTGERRIGKLLRVLMFRSEVDAKALQAKLSAGLLRIKVPKRISSFEGWKVSVE
jgi:HSP20 family molecular chaperone IbpA